MTEQKPHILRLHSGGFVNLAGFTHVERHKDGAVSVHWGTARKKFASGYDADLVSTYLMRTASRHTPGDQCEMAE